MEEEIKAEFEKIGFFLDDEEAILKKCLAFCINYNLKPSDVVSSWEAYYLNRQLNGSAVQNAEMDGFLLHLQNEQKEAIIKEEPGLHIYLRNDVDTILNVEDGEETVSILGTGTCNYQDPFSEPFDSTPQTNGRTFSSAKSSKLITPFGQRSHKFVVKFSIDNMPNTENGQKEDDHENHEDDVIRKVQPGRGCSLVVHGSKPETGCRFMYDRIEDRFYVLESRIRKHATAFASSKLYEEPVDPTVSSQIIASGPFTTTDNLLFEPRVVLLAYAKRKPPQLLILFGLFVDSEHPEIEKGTTDRSFDEIFHFEILKRLQDYTEFMGYNARVIRVPSIRDANHDFVFPQPAFDIHPPDLKHQVTSLTNPGILEAYQIGCCSVDVLKNLSGEEISRNPTGGAPSDRMGRLVNHILGQRSFYPLYPPAEGVPLDFSLAPEALEISSIPDILILPSDMKYFVKFLTLGGRVEGEEQVKCICVNPGRLPKGQGEGTFVELNCYGNPDTTNASIIAI